MPFVIARSVSDAAIQSGVLGTILDCRASLAMTANRHKKPPIHKGGWFFVIRKNYSAAGASASGAGAAAAAAAASAFFAFSFARS